MGFLEPSLKNMVYPDHADFYYDDDRPDMEKVKEESKENFIRRSSNYKRLIYLANAFLTLSSLIVICIALLLIYNYRLHDLDFWHPYFLSTPILILILGFLNFITSTYTFIIIKRQNRATLIVMIVLLSTSFIPQIASIYFSMRLKVLFIQTSPGEGQTEVLHYDEAGFEWVKPKWDALQAQFRCCGASESMNFGYQNYHGAQAFQRKSPGVLSVPDSCCKEPKPGCGVDRYAEGTLPNPSFFTDSCLAIMKETLGEVSDMLDVYMLLVSLMVIVELVSVGLASSNMAHISRRMKHSRSWSKVLSQTYQPADAMGGEFLPSFKTRESRML